MKVHFSSTVDNIKNSINTYRFIHDVLYSNGHTFTRDWIEEAYNHHIEGKTYSDNEALEIVNKTRDAIMKCDLAIFESSIQSFGVGFQAAIANYMQKPILILQKNGTRALGVMGTANNSLIRKHVIYSNHDQLKTAILNFINEYDFPQKDLRFNMLLSREILYYLTNESDNTGVSKSQIVRNLLKEEINQKKKKI